MIKPVHIVGGGLAGSEAAWQLAEAGVPVILHEMRGIVGTDAHKTDGLAELVCSNSFRSDDPDNNAVGLIHQEMRALSSLIMREAGKARVPAGSALAVDRDIFSDGVTAALSAHPNVTIVRELVDGLPPADWDSVIIATGPLTAAPLAEAIRSLTWEDALAFFDAIAPVIHFDSINTDIAWFQSRWDKGDGRDYLNCPMDRDQSEAFIDALLAADDYCFIAEAYGQGEDADKRTAGLVLVAAALKGFDCTQYEILYDRDAYIIDSTVVAGAQEALRDLGLYTAGIDGIPGPGYQRAFEELNTTCATFDYDAFLERSAAIWADGVVTDAEALGPLGENLTLDEGQCERWLRLLAPALDVQR